MAYIECKNGHIYNPEQFQECPYCEGESSVIHFDSDSFPAKNRTVAPEGYRDRFASGGGNGGGVAVAPRKTVAPEAYRERFVSGDDGEDGTMVIGPGKTVAPEAYRKRQDDRNKTVAIYKKRYDMEPVVGWLVCVEGTEKGKAFHLWAKINTIGRGEKMDVSIPSDPTISKDSHARLAYDPKHSSYQLLPGTSVNNIYLNDEPVYIPTKLAAYDLIEMGDTKLLFIPLCGDRFRWETEKRRED